MLLDYFLQRLGKEDDALKRVKRVAPQALEVLEKYNWPGNVRELENAISRAAVMARGDSIFLDDLPLDVREPKSTVVPAEQVGQTVDTAVAALFAMARNDPKVKIIPAVERELIVRALAETGGNQLQAAKLLGMTRATLRKRIEKFGITRRLELD